MVDATLRLLGSMRIALYFLLMTAPAMAQSSSVTVNSSGVTSDGRVLIDPGTGQTRVLPPLLQPWQFETVKLRPPRAKAAAIPTETAAAEPAPAPVAEPPAPPRKPRAVKPPAEAVASVAEKPRRTASVAPPPPSSPPPGSGLSGIGDLDLLTVAPPAKPAPPTPKPVVAKPAPPPAIAKPAAESKPVQRASIEPPKARGGSGKARDTIIFAANASDPSGSAVGAVRALASSLANTLNDGSARVQLNAYAGQRGEKSSDTRRLALKRALVVRQLLIDDGIASERIDVFALGGADDDGPLDRVDVLIKG